ncbi:cell division protein FtsA [Saccharicrinis sp. FJH2]|uniref:cell division protein FtsA n=1 Tax=Saccharicrinis sp. FJH65 TaxID=3344659 RepID=UPI0035F38D23
MEKFIAALDLGTSEIRGVLGKKDANGNVSVLAVKKVKSDGITRGLIINLDTVARAVREIGLDLEKSTGKKIEKFFVGSGGSMIYARQNSSYKRMNQKGEFSADMIADLRRENESIVLDFDAEIIDIKNQGYIVDDEFEIVDPVGVHGSKIEGDYVVMGIKRNDKETIRKCIEKAGYELAGIVLTPLATAETLLSKDEKELGAVSVDFGAGKTSVVVYKGNKLSRIAVLPFGGNVVSKDLATGCNVILDKAEKAKIKHGSAVAELQSEDDRITIPATPGWEAKELSFKTMAYIIQSRVEEILANVLNQIEKSSVYEKLGAGIVLSGGSAQLKDIQQLVKLKTGLDVRIGVPSNVHANLNENTCAGIMGILAEADEDCVKKEEFKTLEHKKVKQKKQKVERTGNLFGNLLKTVDNFFDDEDKSM